MRNIAVRPIARFTVGLPLILIGALVTRGPGAAQAAETWLQCDGNVVTAGSFDGKAENDSKPVHEIYAYDDGTKRFFKYSDTRKTLDPVFVSDYSPKQIKWDTPGGAGYGDAKWDGELDRDKMALKIVRHEQLETMTWTESCKPTPPIPPPPAAK